MTEKTKKSKGLMSLILTPLAFALVGYLLLGIAFSASLETVTSFWNFMTTGDTVMHESEDLMINRLDGYTDTVPSSLITFPKIGDRYGELIIESAGIQGPVYFGDSKKVLSKGIGQYAGSMFVGSGSTVLLSGHNNTYLHTLGQAAVGDKVKLSTNYGDYVYEITGTAIRNSRDSKAFDLGAETENLVIYTCYPFDTLGLTSKRYFVYCKYVSGPKILYDK